MNVRFECFAHYVLRHTNGQPWVVLNKPSQKYPNHFRFTEKRFSELKARYEEEKGYAPYSPAYLAADNVDWNKGAAA